MKRKSITKKNVAVSLLALVGVSVYSSHLEKKALSSTVRDNYIEVPTRDNTTGTISVLGSAALISEDKNGSVGLSLYKGNESEQIPFEAVNMFPGDTLERTVTLKVHHEKEANIRFRAENIEGKLSEVLKFKVTADGDVLYDGYLKDMASYDILLREGKDEIVYQMTAYLDTSVGNEYQLEEAKADLVWETDSDSLTKPPKTGDESPVLLYLGTMTLTLIGIVLIVKRRREHG